MESGSLTILSAGLEPLGGSETEDQVSELDAAAMQASLQAINSKLKLGWMTRHEVIAIAPSHRLTARFLETLSVEEGTLADLVAFEVSEALQVPINDIAWDMLISSKIEGDAKKKLLWIAARKGYIDNLLSVWPKDRLSPTQITPDFWGYYEYLLETDSSHLSETSLLISREGDRATITIADRSAIYLTRSVPLKRPPRQGTELEGEDSEEYALAMEIERTLFYAADRSAPEAPKRMICCGFEDWKLDRLQMVADGNGLALAHLTRNGVLESFAHYPDIISQDHLPLLCIAFCQLKQGILGPNLLEIEEEPREWKSYIPDVAIPSRKFVTIGGGLLALFLALWIGKSAWFNSAIEARLSRGEELIRLSNKLQKEEIALRQLTRTNLDYAGMFLFLAKTLPEGVFVKNLTIDSKTGLEMTLTGGNNQQAVDLMAKLNESDFFREMVVDRSVVEKDGFAIYLKGKMKFGR